MFVHAAFWRFSESPNGLTITSDQVNKSEMDVSKSLKRENSSLLKTQGEFLLDITDSASSGDYK